MQGSKAPELVRQYQSRPRRPNDTQLPARDSKVIRVSEGTYKSLVGIMGARETFNDVVQRLLDDHYNITRRTE